VNNALYLEYQSRVESNARSYPRRLPLAIVKAQGLRVTDADGRVFIDCLAGAGALALGHNHPVVVEALRDHLTSGLPMQTLDLMTPVKQRFVAELLATLPASFAARARVQFCSPSGADAVEAAMKLVKTATGRAPIWAMQGGFHGQTHGALALMGNLGPKRAVQGLMPGVQSLPFPYSYRCAMGSSPCTDCRCADYMQSLLIDPESGALLPAAVITEVVQGEGGAIRASDDWLRRVRTMTREHDVPLIFDEVQTGWGRTGKMYAFEHSGVVPDVLVLSKAIGGGLPLAVVVYDERLDLWKPGAHSGTFRGNQMAMTAGLATLEYLRSNQLTAHADAMGVRFLANFAELEKQDYVGEVRGTGLMLGIEIVDPLTLDGAGRPRGDGALAARIQAECFARGLIVELGGRHGAVIRMLPPLIVTADEVDTICGIVVESCAAAARTRMVASV
jgi:diaminobutyrate-2-oxoglutarate transaminase